MNHSPLQGAEDLNNDFYLKENVDRTVIFESVPNKGRFVTIPYRGELLRNFSVNLVVSLVLVVHTSKQYHTIDLLKNALLQTKVEVFNSLMCRACLKLLYYMTFTSSYSPECKDNGTSPSQSTLNLSQTYTTCHDHLITMFLS